MVEYLLNNEDNICKAFSSSIFDFIKVTLKTRGYMGRGGGGRGNKLSSLHVFSTPASIACWDSRGWHARGKHFFKNHQQVELIRILSTNNFTLVTLNK